MDFAQQIREAGTPRDTKAQVIDYYRGTFGKGWQAKLTRDIAANNGMKPHNIERRFNPDRINNVPRTKKEKADYQTIADQIPTIPPAKGYHISGTVYIKFSDGDCEEREVDEYIDGEEAKALSETASVQIVISHYMEDSLHDEPSARQGDCDEPDLIVEPIE